MPAEPSASPWAVLLWGVMGTGLVVYALTGGADLGAGLWALLARGPRKAQQRQAIISALGPIWEANHVWLIFVIVVMFSAFSRAFAAISIALHIPIALALLGLVLRGASYVFHAYGIQSQTLRQRWVDSFAWSSTLTPVALGCCVGGLASSDIVYRDGHIASGFLAGWTSPFAICVGLLALSLFALLSAVYLAAASEAEVAEDFRNSALMSEAVAFLFALLAFVAARRGAPDFYAQLVGSVWLWPLQFATAAAALLTCYWLYTGRYARSRFSAAVQVSLVVIGWGAAMDGHFILPTLSLEAASTHPEVLPYLAMALGSGSLILGPALWYLFRVFRRV